MRRSVMTTLEAVMGDETSSKSVCDYEFSKENLQALWTEFQRSEQATCPKTKAEINLELENHLSSGKPTVQLSCEKCERSTQFNPGPLEGFEWAE